MLEKKPNSIVLFRGFSSLIWRTVEKLVLLNVYWISKRPYQLPDFNCFQYFALPPLMFDKTSFSLLNVETYQYFLETILTATVNSKILLYIYRTLSLEFFQFVFLHRNHFILYKLLRMELTFCQWRCDQF